MDWTRGSGNISPFAALNKTVGAGSCPRLNRYREGGVESSLTASSLIDAKSTPMGSRLPGRENPKATVKSSRLTVPQFDRQLKSDKASVDPRLLRLPNRVDDIHMQVVISF